MKGQHGPGQRSQQTSRGARAPRRVGLLSVHTSPLEQPGTGDSGGMNVAITELARGLLARDVDVEVFTRTNGADLPPTVETADGVRVHHVSAGPPHLPKSDLASHLCAFYLGLTAHPALREVELLHGHYWMSGWVGRQARRRLGLPLVQTFHTLARVKNAALAPGDAPEPALRVTAEDRVAAEADAIIAPSPAEAAVLRRAYAVGAERVHVVPPGVDLERFRPDARDRRAVREELGGGPILLFVGRLQPLKGPDTAVRTLAALDGLLPADGAPPRLVVVGGASGSGSGTTDPDRLRALAAALGVEDRVALLSPRPQDELARLYRAADVVLMPSRSESFGLVALEAQACGTPVVAAAAGGLQHAVGGAGGGALVTEHTPEAFAAAAARYLLDPAAHTAAATAGAERAARHRWSRTAEQTLTVYSAALQTQRSGALRVSDRPGA